jgi:anti-sigma factor RsiW
MTELSDELLVAYVDGQLAREQRRAVEGVLKQDEVVARRAKALKAAHDRFESAFEAILAGELGEIMDAAPSPPPAIRGGNGLAKLGFGIAGAGLALGAMVAGLGWPLVTPTSRSPGYCGASDQALTQPVAPTPATRGNPQTDAAPAQPEQGSKPQLSRATWQDEALRAHALLSRASVEVSLESQRNQDLAAFQIAQAIAPAVKLPELRAQGFKFMRAELLRFGDEPLVQMLYLGAAKTPVALYAMRGGGEDSSPTYRRDASIGSMSWTDHGIAYLLAGEEGEATLSRLAAIVRNGPAAPDSKLQPQSDPASSAAASGAPAIASDPVVTGANLKPEPTAPDSAPDSAPTPSPAR